MNEISQLQQHLLNYGKFPGKTAGDAI